jgi:tetratricopeptide (TPR) repeat protein
MRTRWCIVAFATALICADDVFGQELDFKSLVNRGVKAYQARRYGEAVDAFRKAYEIRQEPTLIYNIAQSLERMGNIDDAIAHYETYVEAPGTTAEERADALEHLKALRREKAARDNAVEQPLEGPKLPALGKTEKPPPPPPPPPPPAVEPTVAPGDLVMVVHAKNTVSKLEPGTVKQIYLGKEKVWPDGERIKPYSRPLGTNAGRAFFGAKTGLSSRDYQKYWQQAQLSGEGLSPPIIADPKALLEIVSKNRGAVGFALRSELPKELNGVRLVDVR